MQRSPLFPFQLGGQLAVAALPGSHLCTCQSHFRGAKGQSCLLLRHFQQNRMVLKLQCLCVALVLCQGLSQSLGLVQGWLQFTSPPGVSHVACHAVAHAVFLLEVRRLLFRLLKLGIQRSPQVRLLNACLLLAKLQLLAAAFQPLPQRRDVQLRAAELFLQGAAAAKLQGVVRGQLRGLDPRLFHELLRLLPHHLDALLATLGHRLGTVLLKSHRGIQVPEVCIRLLQLSVRQILRSLQLALRGIQLLL
mmetsp:Transcript_62294/g.98559  ORF Transcript_62294/g.98559 Transcript_62294/m.98559 type:complete len:249 (-) Transcript_62294:652-1398(-)